MDRLELRYIALSLVTKWDRNPKRHDMEAICATIEAHGFIDPPKFDPTLNEGRGGLLYGNGRTEALSLMKERGRPLPRGIASDETGEWFVPIVFGVDATSTAAAEAAAIDHNNLTLTGGGFTPSDMARMWETDEYLSLLEQIAEHPIELITVDLGDLNTLLPDVVDDFAPDDEYPQDEAPTTKQRPAFVEAGADEVPPETYHNPAAANAPPSYVRMVQLYLNTTTLPIFTEHADALQKHFGTTNVTDTVSEALRYACDQLDLASNG